MLLDIFQLAIPYAVWITSLKSPLNKNLQIFSIFLYYFSVLVFFVLTNKQTNKQRIIRLLLNLWEQLILYFLFSTALLLCIFMISSRLSNQYFCLEIKMKILLWTTQMSFSDLLYHAFTVKVEGEINSSSYSLLSCLDFQGKRLWFSSMQRQCSNIRNLPTRKLYFGLVFPRPLQ